MTMHPNSFRSIMICHMCEAMWTTPKEFYKDLGSKYKLIEPHDFRVSLSQLARAGLIESTRDEGLKKKNMVKYRLTPFGTKEARRLRLAIGHKP